jgi:vacuolar-type H+-ATPase catalytic subunit A/Vma1
MADEIRKGLKEVASLIVATNKKLDEANDTALADTSTEISKSVTENTTAINDLSTNLAESTKNTRSVTENITTSAFRAFSSDQDSVRKLQKEEIDERKRANEELKQKIEEQGGLAKDNSKYVKESYEIQKEEFKLRKRNPNLSRAAQSEIDDEAKKAAKENRKTGGLMQKMAGSVLNSAKNVGKTALMGLFGIASVLGLGAFLIGLSLVYEQSILGQDCEVV